MSWLCVAFVHVGEGVKAALLELLDNALCALLHTLAATDTNSHEVIDVEGLEKALLQ